MQYFDNPMMHDFLNQLIFTDKNGERQVSILWPIGDLIEELGDGQEPEEGEFRWLFPEFVRLGLAKQVKINYVLSIMDHVQAADTEEFIQHDAFGLHFIIRSLLCNSLIISYTITVPNAPIKSKKPIWQNRVNPCERAWPVGQKWWSESTSEDVKGFLARLEQERADEQKTIDEIYDIRWGKS